MNEAAMKKLRAALCAAYAAREREGMVCGVGETVEARRMAWVSMAVGVPRASLKDCSPFELSFCLDTLNGKTTKLFTRLEAAAKAAGIADLQAWLNNVCRSKKLVWLRATPGDRESGSGDRESGSGDRESGSGAVIHMFHEISAIPYRQLPISKVWRLVQFIETRRRA